MGEARNATLFERRHGAQARLTPSQLSCLLRLTLTENGTERGRYTGRSASVIVS